jgi:transposase
MINCGIDWAEAHHDVALVDDAGKTLTKVRVGADAAGFSRLLEVIVEQGGSPEVTPVAIETDKNLSVVALAAAGFRVYPINPRAVARYRERHVQSGGKSDPGDAIVLANICGPIGTASAAAADQRARLGDQGAGPSTPGGHLGLAPGAEQAPVCAAGVLSPSNQGFSEPEAPRRGGSPDSRPSPTVAASLTRRRVVTLLHRCGRRNDPALVEQILTDLKAPALQQPARVEAALALTVAGLLRIVVTMRTTVEELEAALATEFDSHDLAPVLRSAPGLGPVLAARVLAEVGDDPARFASVDGLRAFAGTAAVTRASGRSHYVKARKVRNKRLADACHWWAYATLTRSPDAGLSTTAAEPPVIITTPPCGTSPTSSSAGCGGA